MNEKERKKNNWRKMKEKEIIYKIMNEANIRRKLRKNKWKKNDERMEVGK